MNRKIKTARLELLEKQREHNEKKLIKFPNSPFLKKLKKYLDNQILKLTPQK